MVQDSSYLTIKYEFSDRPLDALRALLVLKKKAPQDFHLQILEIRLLMRLGYEKHALDLACSKIQSLVGGPEAPKISELFRALGKNRHFLPWSSPVLEQLAKLFLSIKDYREAGWCIHQAELQLGNGDRAEKRLIQIADQAMAAQDISGATGLFKYYLANHSKGPFGDYAHKAIRFLQGLVSDQ
ncbi:MAG TPA: hypothetical protein VLM37_11895 [Fibrobacteraceae bacterium]|nr:hypothetical protein [Fibrobacteraceae bacterium]